MRNDRRSSLLYVTACHRRPDDILLNKGQIIRRCLARVREEYRDDPGNLSNPTKQDSIVIIQRACDAVIDLAVHFAASAFSQTSTARLGVALVDWHSTIAKFNISRPIIDSSIRMRDYLKMFFTKRSTFGDKASAVKCPNVAESAPRAQHPDEAINVCFVAVETLAKATPDFDAIE